MEKDNCCPTVLIEDVPVDEDEFKSEGLGAHERVANAIAQMFLHEIGGKVVGLEGKWGAGKSSVVKILRKQCKDGKNFTTVQFDAWAHEGDPLRRTYLETVIRALQDKNWVDKDKWNTVIEELAKRVSSNSRRIIPTASKLGGIFAIAALFIPLGISILNATPSSIYYQDLSDVLQNWLGVIGLLIILSPIAVLLGNEIRVIWKRNISKKPLTNEWTFLSSHSLINEKSESITTPEPTSIEFEKCFTDLMKEALSDSDRRLLLILDNLDRVDPKTALEIWGTLQAFVQEHNRDKSWFQQLWILVPYDREGLKRIWDKSDTNKPEVAESFFDKSFQIRFQVPPPVLSNWKKYLEGLLHKALPRHNSDTHKVYEIFNLFRPDLVNPPTPRQIKIFVNQIGALHRQWQDDYQLGDMAYFCLKANDKDLPELLRAGTLPQAEAIRLLGDDLRKNMAGLAFNVEANQGQQLLLADQIYNALIKSDAASLGEFASVHKDGFWAVLESVVSNRIQHSSALEVCGAILCLNEIGMTEGQYVQDINSIKDQIYKTVLATSNWLQFDDKIAKGLEAVCDWKSEIDFTEKLYSHLANSLPSWKIESENVEVKAKSFLKLIDSLKSKGYLTEKAGQLTFTIESEQWTSLCGYISEAKNSEYILKRIQGTVAANSIEVFLQNNAINRKFESRHLDAIRITPRTLYANKWENLTITLKDRLQAGAGATVPEAYLLLLALLEIEKDNTGAASTAIKSLANDGHLLHHLAQAHQKNDTRSKALISFMYLREKPDFSKSSIVGDGEAGFNALQAILNATDESLAKEFLDAIATWSKKDLIQKFVEKDYKPLVIACLKYEVRNGDIESIVSPKLFISDWNLLQTNLADDYPTILDTLVKNPVLYDEIKEDGFYEVDAPLYLSLVKRQDIPQIPAFRGWLEGIFESINTNDWKEILKDYSDCLSLLIWLKENGSELTLDNAFSDAIREDAKLIISSQKKLPENIRQKWSVIMSTIKSPIRIELKTYLLEMVEEADGKVSSEFFEMYKDEVFNPDTLSSSDKIISHFFTPLLQERNSQGLVWMRDFLTKNPRFFNKVENADAFKIRLQRSLTDDSKDDVQAIIVDIAKILKVEPLEAEKTNEEVSDNEAA